MAVRPILRPIEELQHLGPMPTPDTTGSGVYQGAPGLFEEAEMTGEEEARGRVREILDRFAPEPPPRLGDFRLDITGNPLKVGFEAPPPPKTAQEVLRDIYVRRGDEQVSMRAAEPSQIRAAPGYEPVEMRAFTPERETWERDVPIPERILKTGVGLGKMGLAGAKLGTEALGTVADVLSTTQPVGVALHMLEGGKPEETTLGGFVESVLRTVVPKLEGLVELVQGKAPQGAAAWPETESIPQAVGRMVGGMLGMIDPAYKPTALDFALMELSRVNIGPVRQALASKQGMALAKKAALDVDAALETGGPFDRRMGFAAGKRLPKGGKPPIPPPIQPPPPITPTKPMGGLSGKKKPPPPPATATSAPPPTPSRESSLAEVYNDFQEAITDRFVRWRQTAERSGARDLIGRIDIRGGAGSQALQRYETAISNAKAVAPDIRVGELNDYLKAKHALEVFAQHGKRVAVGTFKTPAEAQAAVDNLVAQLGPGKQTRLEQAGQSIADVFHAALRRSAKAGLLTEDLAEDLIVKYPFYNPLHYVEILEQQAAYIGQKHLTMNAAAMVKRLSERGIFATPIKPLEGLYETLAATERRIQRNLLMKDMVTAAQKDPQVAPFIHKSNKVVLVASVQGKPVFRPKRTGEIGQIVYLEEGKPQIYDVPATLYEAMRDIGPNEAIAKIGAINSLAKAAFVNYNPLFVVSNMIIDTATAFFREGVLPHQTLKVIVDELRGVANAKNALEVYRLSGAEQMRWFGQEPAKVAKFVAGSGGKVIGDNRSLRRAILEAVPTVGQAGEQAPRKVVFYRELDKTLPGWRKMAPEVVADTPEARAAASRALEATINFGKGGWLVKQLDPILLYLNAGVQGSLLPYRALRDNPMARVRLAGMLGGYAGLTSYNMQYPEYFDIPEQVRRGSLIVMLPSEKYDIQGRKEPNYLAIIPRLREFSAFFGTVSYLMERLFKNNDKGVGRFVTSIAGNVLPISNIPVPPIVQEAFSQAANYDIFRGRPIVSQHLLDEEPGKQFTQYTGRTPIEAGQRIGLSPARIEHAITGLGGGTAQTIMSVPNWILDTFFPRKGVEKSTKASLEIAQSLPSAARERYLAKLPKELRKEVETEARRPETKLPVLGAFQGRFAPGRGGEVFESGIQNEDVRKELVRKAVPKDVLSELSKIDVQVPALRNTATYKGNLHRLTDKELEVGTKELGELLTKRLEALIKTPAWEKNEKIARVRKVKELISEAQEKAIERAMKEYPLSSVRLTPVATPLARLTK